MPHHTVTKFTVYLAGIFSRIANVAREASYRYRIKEAGKPRFAPKVVKQDFISIGWDGLHIAHEGQTLYAMTYHPKPGYKRLSPEYFIDTERELAKHYAALQNG